MTARDDIEAVAGGVLAGHYDPTTCVREHGVRGDVPMVEAHCAHVAAVLAEALAPMVAEVRAEALREAANAWTQGAWSNVMLPKPTPPAVPVIAYSNRMGDWLRARAEAVAERGGGSYHLEADLDCPRCGEALHGGEC